jgi:ABC-type glycerol-3-phosphate transport system substrate-binding protein
MAGTAAETARVGGMTRRRHVGGMVAALGGSGVLGACSGAGSGASAKQSAAKAPVTVEYWTFWAQERLDFLLPHLPAFQQRSGYITVNVNAMGTSDLRTKLRAAVVAGTPPESSIGDIFSYTWYRPASINSGAMKPYLALRMSQASAKRSA